MYKDHPGLGSRSIVGTRYQVRTWYIIVQWATPFHRQVGAEISKLCNFEFSKHEIGLSFEVFSIIRVEAVPVLMYLYNDNLMN